MPVIKIQTSVAAPADASVMLLALAAAIAEILGKSPQKMMTVLEPNIAMTFAETTEPTAFVEVKSVGQMGDKASLICAAICEHLSRSLGIAPDHVYIELADTTAPMWGWNGKTLA